MQEDSNKQLSDELLSQKVVEEISPFLKNIQKGLQKFGSVKSFNSKLQQLVESDNEKDEIIKIVMESVCNEFSITKRSLLASGVKGKPNIKEARYTCACILHFEFDFTFRLIGRHVFKQKQFGFVSLATNRHKQLNEKVKVDREYKLRYDKVLSDVQRKILNKK